MEYIMGCEPAEGVTPEEIRNRYAGKTDERSLAEAYALIHNEAWWVEDNEYDFEEGTKEHSEAVAITDAWFSLMEEYQTRIFDILSSEGVEIPEKGYVKVLIPFMERNGFFEGRGWWIENSEVVSENEQRLMDGISMPLQIIRNPKVDTG